MALGGGVGGTHHETETTMGWRLQRETHHFTRRDGNIFIPEQSRILFTTGRLAILDEEDCFFSNTWKRISLTLRRIGGDTGVGGNELGSEGCGAETVEWFGHLEQRWTVPL